MRERLAGRQGAFQRTVPTLRGLVVGLHRPRDQRPGLRGRSDFGSGELAIAQPSAAATIGPVSTGPMVQKLADGLLCTTLSFRGVVLTTDRTGGAFDKGVSLSHGCPPWPSVTTRMWLP